jgi:2-polyprenyl-3-methyl-5-hydroxy-6-metoxy-1,4-benzoquinol methylase
MTNYNQKFYQRLSEQATKSSDALVPIIYEKLRPGSILDVGCGHGTWLKKWSSYVPDIFGVDGKWVEEKNLEIPSENFMKIDLEKSFDLKKKFDLVTCLEVAEHVTVDSKDLFINSLVTHSDIILFSAAIPEQGGDNHYNEQWPSYWVEEFKKRDYVYLDPFRHLIWKNENIRYYYRQNIILFAHKNTVKTNVFLQQEEKIADRSLIDVIHPYSIDENIRSLKKIFPIFRKTFIKALKNRISF